MLIKLIDNDSSHREIPLLYTQFILKDLVIGDWSHKVRAKFGVV